MAPILPSLSGLSSLIELNLRDCNLCEGDIPNDISCLSSLVMLNLSGNNFISLPDSLTRLSKLKGLALMNCRGLKSLPELPTSVEYVSIDDCASLELIANPSKVYNRMVFMFKGINCCRLAENINALTLLKKHLKVFANSRERFAVIMPGSEIPEWFSHQRVDSSIKMPLPLNIRNDSQWMGVAFCCIFAGGDSSGDEQIWCDVSCRGARNLGMLYIPLGNRFNQPIKNDHLFLRYWGRDLLYPYSLKNECGESETENTSTPDCSNQECDEVELSFEYFGKGVGVKKCGVGIVYEKDLEDVQLTTEQHINQSSPQIE
ncbi:disease resistance-like protein DSC1 [Hibiscus syriacus]|uniref:disease resistance-like protein DSC1 n=1 Tax=Hibiscus syriacus TaxID=106335 RepID=UPI0019243DAE|nr:disease resistance-like protein DSC1 [Hibiscus syriacus]